MAKDNDRSSTTPDLKDLYLALDDEQLKDLKAAMEASKKGYKYDHKTKQYDFRFAKGGAVCRGQGRVSRKRNFRVT